MELDPEARYEWTWEGDVTQMNRDKPSAWKEPVQPASAPEAKSEAGGVDGEVSVAGDATPGEAVEATESAAPVVALPDDVLHHVDPRSITTESIVWWIIIALSALGGMTFLGVFSFKAIGPLWLRLTLVGGWGGFMLGMIWLGWRFPRWEYQRTRYRLGTDGIEIHRGVVWRQVINVPRSRVQHTDVIQGPVLRHYGLAVLVIHTAGTQHSTVTLPGLAHETALGLRDFLIRGERPSPAPETAPQSGARADAGEDDSPGSQDQSGAPAASCETSPTSEASS